VVDCVEDVGILEPFLGLMLAGEPSDLHTEKSYHETAECAVVARIRTSTSLCPASCR
jgi:hypothetical protein